MKYCVPYNNWLYLGRAGRGFDMLLRRRNASLVDNAVCLGFQEIHKYYQYKF